MRSVFERRLIAGAVGAAIALGGAAARADGGTIDPTYGRIAGDLTVVVGAGAVVAPRGPRAEGELRLRYLESAGVFATYEDAAIFGSAAEPERVLVTGLELRPFFFFRWLQGRESSRAGLDLVVDSIGLEVGATFAQPRGDAFASSPGVQAGLGLEVPLFATATGLWLGVHGGVRWSDDALASGVVRGADDRAAYLAFTLSWHQVVVTHLVDVGDRAPR
jgi:hypothetical protein